jgi:Transposase zinc-binding domain
MGTSYDPTTYHLERCDCCQHERPCYDSRGDRHCPTCQSLARAACVEKPSEVPQTHYFHVVFTVTEQIASIA